MQTALQDLRFAFRQLRRTPGFAITAVLTLALGIGANTAIFSLLDQALLRSLPVSDPGKLVVLQGTKSPWNGGTSDSGGDTDAYFSYPMYKDLRDQNQVFSGLIGTSPANAAFRHDNDTHSIDAEMVTGNYFTVLGVQPFLGRMFTQTDDAAVNANPLVVVSYDFWRNQLASDTHIIGSSVSLNDHPFQVIGVAAPSFHSAVWGQTPAVFVPMAMIGQMTTHSGGLDDHRYRWMNILGRMKPGFSAAQAESGVAPLWHSLRAEELKNLGTVTPRFIAGFLTKSRLLVLPGARGFSYKRPNLETPFLAVMAMAVLVLLISAVNVASLLLVRSASRIKEFSLRAALGAQIGRIVTQLLMEGLLIGIGGGAIGLLLAPIALRVLVNQLADPDSGTPFSAGIDGRVLLFNFSVAILVSLIFSLAPALQLRHLNLTSTLRESSSTGSGSLLSLRRLVVCLQIGLSVILLVASGLFLRTMQSLRSVEVGFNTAHLFTFETNLSQAGYAAESRPALNQRIMASLQAIPGVTGVAATDDPELTGNHNMNGAGVAGYQPPPDDSFSIEDPTISADYLNVMQVPLLAGRIFDEQDTVDHPKVAVVNQAFAKHFCGSVEACVGRQMSMTDGFGSTPKMDTTIVGVVRDAKHGGMREDVTATCYRPLHQSPRSADLYFYLRYNGSSSDVLSAVRSTMRQIDPGLALSSVRTMDEQIDQNLSNERMIALLATSFGCLATLLAGVGLYGVLAYSTAQRTREIGIRMALGSTRLAVSRLVLTDVLKLAALGVVVAIPVAMALSSLIRTQLYGVSTADPVILCSVVGLIALVALLAATIPARRAASIEPTTALRTE